MATKKTLPYRITKCLAVLLLGFPLLGLGQMTSMDLVEMDKTIFSSSPPDYPPIDLIHSEDQVWLDSLRWVREQSAALRYADHLPTLYNITANAKSPVLQDAARFWSGLALHSVCVASFYLAYSQILQFSCLA